MAEPIDPGEAFDALSKRLYDAMPDIDHIPGLYFDPDGNEITLAQWSAQWADDTRRRVALAIVGGVRVSTVWVGINYRFDGGAPLIFETMTFGEPFDCLQWRHTTRTAALAFHDQVCATVRDWRDGRITAAAALRRLGEAP